MVAVAFEVRGDTRLVAMLPNYTVRYDVLATLNLLSQRVSKGDGVSFCEMFGTLMASRDSDGVEVSRYRCALYCTYSKSFFVPFNLSILSQVSFLE